MVMSHLENKDSDAGGEDVGTSICEEEESEVDVMDLGDDPELWPDELYDEYYREEQEKMQKGLERLAARMGKRVEEIWW
ncbi:uncharacterized protein LOC110771934 isoform X2 [Prunus avium]|nr:uncharacterized protein LOC110771934 isoform X2 [Prunus avium]